MVHRPAVMPLAKEAKQTEMLLVMMRLEDCG